MAGAVEAAALADIHACSPCRSAILSDQHADASTKRTLGQSVIT
jgi:hypothetical protein